MACVLSQTVVLYVFFFFSSRRRHTRLQGDWSSDVCSSDLTGFAVPAAGVYPLRLVAGHSTGGADLEWFSIRPDGTRILLNDTNNANALLAFRGRNAGARPVLNNPSVAAGAVTLSWTGVGLLEEATSVNGPWYISPR